MSYIDDKLDIIEAKPEWDKIARARYDQLSCRRGFQYSLAALPRITIWTMAGSELWELDGEQPGVPAKAKLYRKVVSK